MLFQSKQSLLESVLLFKASFKYSRQNGTLLNLKGPVLFGKDSVPQKIVTKWSSRSAQTGTCSLAPQNQLLRAKRSTRPLPLHFGESVAATFLGGPSLLHPFTSTFGRLDSCNMEHVSADRDPQLPIFPV